MTRRLHTAVLLAFALGTSPLLAQTTPLSADQKELAAYRLTMPTVQKVMRVMQAFTAQAHEDPRTREIMKLEAEIEALEAKENPTEADEARLGKLRERADALAQEEERQQADDQSLDTISEMEAEITRQPELVAALGREGMAPRELAKFWLAFLQAAMVHGLSQGKVDMAKLPPGVNPENVTFIAAHQKELEAMREEFEALGKKR